MAMSKKEVALFASMQLRIKELESQLVVEEAANRELGIKLKQQIARGNHFAQRAPRPSFAAQRCEVAKQLALELGRAPTRGEVLNASAR